MKLYRDGGKYWDLRCKDYIKQNLMWQEAGFVNGNTNVTDVLHRLSQHIDNLPKWFSHLDSGQCLHKPAPDKWSKKEILGHLIDSAVNNLKRFAEIQFLPQPYQVISYQQNELVLVNNYQNLPNDHLLQLWQSLNRQIIYVIQNIPKEKLNYSVDPGYDNRETKTLGWIIADYVAHLEHHMEQIFP